MAPRRRHFLIIVGAIVFAAFVTAVGLLGAGTISIGGLSATTTTAPPEIDPMMRYLGAETKALEGAADSLNVTLPERPGQPAPAWPASPWRVPLPSHEVVGFVPWYELGAATSSDSAPASDFSEVVYSSLGVQPNGSLDVTGGPNNGGYDELSNGSGAGLVSWAHAAGTRVLLGLSSANQPTIDALCAHPVQSGQAMARSVIALLPRYGFDGVDLDIEGQGLADRSGFVRLVATFSAALRAADSSWSLLVNTYPDSASDPGNFFDVRSLARHVTQFFVMAYDMSDQQVPSATAPLQGVDLSVASSLATYAAAGLADKVVLGEPFYGYDFTASSRRVGSDTIGTPYSVSYADVVQAGRPSIWDPASETPYTVFRRSGRWHQTWFDSPVSIALKTAVASQFKAAGVGAWEIGMAKGEPDIVQAMLGGSPPVRLPLAHQP